MAPAEEAPYDGSQHPSGTTAEPRTDTERLRQEGARRARVEMQIEQLSREAKRAERRATALETRMEAHDRDHARTMAGITAQLAEITTQLATGAGQFKQIEGQIESVAKILAEHLEQHAQDARAARSWWGRLGTTVVTAVLCAIAAGATTAVLWFILKGTVLEAVHQRSHELERESSAN